MDLFLNKISGLINSFHFKQLVMLNITTCEKVLPIYSLFSNYESWGKKEILDEALILQYQFLQNLSISDSEIENILDEIENNSPDLDSFDNGLASYALDACIIFMESLTFLKSKDINSVISVASSSRDLVDMFVQERNDIPPNDKLLDSKIQSDFFMQKEVKRYFELISKIENFKNISLKEIEEIRDFNSQFGEIADIETLTKLYLN
jgi:uncharacterized protein YjaG (DUF416 family)